MSPVAVISFPGERAGFGFNSLEDVVLGNAKFLEHREVTWTSFSVSKTTWFPN